VYKSITGLLGAAATTGSAVAAGLAILAIVSYLYYKRCHREPESLQACSSGIVQHIEPSFNSWTDEVFPFAAMHDRVDVVTVCDYWYLVEGGGAQYVKCAPDPESSPMLLGFYYSDKVCNAGVGSVIGGGIGAVGGIIAGALVGAAIGCATVILCLLAILVAALIAAAAVLVGAFLGGQIAKAQGFPPPSTDDGKVISVGDIVTTQGGLITNGDQDGARTYWFVDSTTLHGHSVNPAPYSHLNAEAALKDPVTGALLDACGPILL
jgi:hypothetical protein